jgi:hypothetical protein
LLGSGFVLCAVLGFAGSFVAQRLTSSGEVEGLKVAQLLVQEGISNEDSLSELQALLTRDVVEVSQVPAWFTSEVLSLEGVSDVRLQSEGELVGFTLAKSSAAQGSSAASASSAAETSGVAGSSNAADGSSVADTSIVALFEELKDRGWTLVQNTEAPLVSGVKEEGVARWLALSWTEVGEDLCVVVRVATA